MFGIEKDFQQLMEQVYGPLNKDKMTDLKFTSPSGETTIKVRDTGRLGTVAPKTKLHIRKMTEIEQVKAEIKVLEKKVALLEEIEKKKETQTLTDLIYDWWEDVFTTNSNDDMGICVDTLVDRIEAWLPKEQSSAGSQNAYVECTVEGFNDCLNKIKRKLR